MTSGPKRRSGELDVRELSKVADFIGRVNKAMQDTGVELDPSFGGLSVEGRTVGNLAWREGGLVFNGRNE